MRQGSAPTVVDDDADANVDRVARFKVGELLAGRAPAEKASEDGVIDLIIARGFEEAGVAGGAAVRAECDQDERVAGRGADLNKGREAGFVRA